MKSKNLITQIVSLVFLAFTFSGLNVIPDEVATRIVEGISNNDFFGLMLYLLTNLGNVMYHWIQQLRKDPKKILAFVDSINFWVSAINIVAAIVFMYTGVTLDPDSLAEFVSLIFSKDYMNAAGLFIMNILIPILKTFISKKSRTIQIPVSKLAA